MIVYSIIPHNIWVTQQLFCQTAPFGEFLTMVDTLNHGWYSQPWLILAVTMVNHGHPWSWKHLYFWPWSTMVAQPEPWYLRCLSMVNDLQPWFNHGWQSDTVVTMVNHGIFSQGQCIRSINTYLKPQSLLKFSSFLFFSWAFFFNNILPISAYLILNSNVLRCTIIKEKKLLSEGCVSFYELINNVFPVFHVLFF